MPDRQFSDPRLAVLYDVFDADRSDLDHYEALLVELGVTGTVLDLGCGTGELACRLARAGRQVVGVDPAEASLAVAQAKPGGRSVRWIHGTSSRLHDLTVEAVVMTGNVAQVFVEDDEWNDMLAGAQAALLPGGLLIFETRDPAFAAWEGWNRHETYKSRAAPDGRIVNYWVDLLDVELPIVRFVATYQFSDGVELQSESTLRFRHRSEIEASLQAAGFVVEDVRGAPDRPDKEFVFVARRS